MVLLALVLSATGPFDSAMTKAVGFYNEAEWDASLRELSKAERYAADDAQRVQVWLYEGVVLANIPDLDGARVAWDKALAVDADAKLPLKVSPRVQAKFDEAQQLAQQNRRAQAAVTGPPAGAAATAPPRSVPVVSIITLALGVAAGAVGLGFGLGANATVNSARAATFQDDKSQLRDQAQTYAIVANVSYAVAGVFALWALVAFFVAE
jgi:hypothetical protein